MPRRPVPTSLIFRMLYSEDLLIYFKSIGDFLGNMNRYADRFLQTAVNVRKKSRSDPFVVPASLLLREHLQETASLCPHSAYNTH